MPEDSEDLVRLLRQRANTRVMFHVSGQGEAAVPRFLLSSACVHVSVANSWDRQGTSLHAIASVCYEYVYISLIPHCATG